MRFLRQRRSQKKFSKCQVKTIEYIVMYLWNCYETRNAHARDMKKRWFPADKPPIKYGNYKFFSRVSSKSAPGGFARGFDARLHCPATVSSMVAVSNPRITETQSEAFLAVRAEAAEVLCYNCPYWKMSSEDIMRERIREIELQAEYAVALKHLEDAFEEMSEQDRRRMADMYGIEIESQ